MVNSIKNKFNNIKYFTYKKRFLKMSLIFGACLLLIIYLITRAYGSYITTAKLRADIDKAIYVFEEETMSFNIDENKIIPSNDPYTYTFSVQNYNSTQTSDVDLTYNINIRSTTNLPLEISLYRNESYSASGATNIIGSPTLRQDADGAWYKLYTESDDYALSYNTQTKDIFTLVIVFPKSYSLNTTYADITENIEVIINSKQTI